MTPMTLLVTNIRLWFRTNVAKCQIWLHEETIQQRTVKISQDLLTCLNYNILNNNIFYNNIWTGRFQKKTRGPQSVSTQLSSREAESQRSWCQTHTKRCERKLTYYKKWRRMTYLLNAKLLWTKQRKHDHNWHVGWQQLCSIFICDHQSPVLWSQI